MNEKKYTHPQISFITVSGKDVIATSDRGTETTPVPDNGGIWDLDVG